ncbi:MAG: hypothetical protein OXI43_10275, partial [Candidatus Poribacteria bacterium]|nr:hypothetical protein [Candidatus Poribacteria bacterium]
VFLAVFLVCGLFLKPGFFPPPPPLRYIKYNTLRKINCESISGSAAFVPARAFWLVAGFCCCIEKDSNVSFVIMSIIKLKYLAKFFRK